MILGFLSVLVHLEPLSVMILDSLLVLLDLVLQSETVLDHLWLLEHLVVPENQLVMILGFLSVPELL